MSGIRYIFVHGLSGWGSYDDTYRKMPYWGMRGGDLMAFLKEKGFDCYAASVAPAGSAWDRVCELYAQLAGARVDYGEGHAGPYRHARYGRDFSSCPLIPDWGEDTRLALLGHSFGGATVRLFSKLLAHGDEAERRETAPGELSPLFAGGMERRVHSVVTLASPMNGTTAYDMMEDPGFDPGSVKTPWWSEILARMMARGTRARPDGRDARDYAGYDMHLDRAAELNRRMAVLPGVYYFSVPLFLYGQAAGRDLAPQARHRAAVCPPVHADGRLPRQNGGRRHGGRNLAGKRRAGQYRLRGGARRRALQNAGQRPDRTRPVAGVPHGERGPYVAAGRADAPA